MARLEGEEIERHYGVLGQSSMKCWAVLRNIPSYRQVLKLKWGDRTLTVDSESTHWKETTRMVE